MSVLARLVRCRRGSAGIETAFALPVLLALGFGAADAGWLLSETHRMKAGLAAGAQLLARSRDVTTSEDEARNLAVTGRTTAGGAPRVKGWTPAQVTVSYRMIANGAGAYSGGDQVRIVRLESARPYAGLGLLSLAGVNAVQVGAVHEERWTGG